MLITFFYAVFGAVLLSIALLNSGFKIFGKETNKSDVGFLITTYLFGTFFLAAGIFLSFMEKKEDIVKPVQVAAEQLQVSDEAAGASTAEKQEGQKSPKEPETKTEPTKKVTKDKSLQQNSNVTHSSGGRTSVFNSNIGWAQIKAEEKFVSCRNVVGREPVGITDQFRSGEQVFVWAQIYAPRPSEKVQLAWYNSNGEMIFAKTYTVHQNLGEGYRIYYWKYLTAGRYTVSLFNGTGEEIGRIAINVE